MVTIGFDWKQKEACLIKKEGECFTHNPKEQELPQCRIVNIQYYILVLGRLVVFFLFQLHVKVWP